MTSYNREKYIAKAIESVLSSTYQDFELIIVDDGSKDDTVNIARSYASRDARVKVYVNDQNLGDYPNRNKAASYATGKYLKYVDADDYIYPHGLGALVSMMEKFPQAGWGLCSLDQFVGRPFPFMLQPREAYLYNYKGPGLFHKAPLSSIIRKSVFDEVNGFKPLRMCGDFEMWHRLALKYPVVLMPHGIVWYREHGEQEVNSYMNYVTQYEQIRKQYLTDPDCPLSKEEVMSINSDVKKRMIRQLVIALLKGRVRLVKETWLKLKA